MMRTTHAVMLALALGAFLPHALAQTAATRPDAQSVIDAARRAFEAGDVGGALQQLRPVGYAGHREAQFALGRMLESMPHPTRANYAEAAKWYYRAAQAGHTGAMNNLAALHVEGRGVPVTYSVARLWYERAALKGFVPSQYNLALMYGRGLGMPRDDARMLSWLQRAADADYDRAQAQLGRRYLEGTGTSANPAKAAEWFRLAATQGHAEAQYYLGVLHKRGSGVVQDAQEARSWLRLAADQGHAGAAWELAQMLESATGGAPPDGDGALALYKAAATANHVPSIERVLRVYTQGGLGQSPNTALAAFWNLKLQMVTTAVKTAAKNGVR